MIKLNRVREFLNGFSDLIVPEVDPYGADEERVIFAFQALVYAVTKNSIQRIEPSAKMIAEFTNILDFYIEINELFDEIKLDNENTFKVKGAKFNKKNLKLTNFSDHSFEIVADNGKYIYHDFFNSWSLRTYNRFGEEVSCLLEDGFNSKRVYNGANLIHYSNSRGDWTEIKYNEKGREIFRKRSNGSWEKREYSKGMVYMTNSKGDKHTYPDDGKNYIVIYK